MAVQKLRAHVEANGPYDVMLGFSQARARRRLRRRLAAPARRAPENDRGYRPAILWP